MAVYAYKSIERLTSGVSDGPIARAAAALTPEQILTAAEEFSRTNPTESPVARGLFSAAVAAIATSSGEGLVLAAYRAWDDERL